MLTKINVLLNIFNIVLIIFLSSIIYGQNSKISNDSLLKPYFDIIAAIHNNVKKQNIVVESTIINKPIVVNEIEKENKDESFISSLVSNISDSLLSKDNESDEETFDFKNVESNEVKVEQIVENNLDKTLENVTQVLNEKKQEVKQPIVNESKKEDVKEDVKEEIKKVDLTETKNINESTNEIILNMKDHKLDTFIFKKTIPTTKRINIYSDLNVKAPFKLKGDSEIFVSKQEYNGLFKIMIKNKVYLIDKSNVDLKYSKQN